MTVVIEVGNFLYISSELALAFPLYLDVHQVFRSERIVDQVIVLIGAFHFVGNEKVLPPAAEESIDRPIANRHQVRFALKTIMLLAGHRKQWAAKSGIIGNRPVPQQVVQTWSYVNIEGNRVRVVIHALSQGCGEVKNQRHLQ